MKKISAAWRVFCIAMICACCKDGARADQLICVSKSGKVTVRSSCRKGENKLDLRGPQGPQGPEGPPGAQGAQGTRGLPGRGIGEALAGGTGIRGVAGGAFSAPGQQNDPWVVDTSFGAVLPAPVTSDKVIISQKTLRSLCNAAGNANTVSSFGATTANDCLRKDEAVNGHLFDQLDKPGQFSQGTTDNICDGTPDNPTAPPGFVCIYLISAQDFFFMHADTVPSGTGSNGFSLSWGSANPDGNTKSKITYSWAYTAPPGAP